MFSILDHEPSSVPDGSGWLAPYRDTFLKELGRLGCCSASVLDPLYDQSSNQIRTVIHNG